MIANYSIIIGAPPSDIWEALTNPDLIKRYLFGTQTETTWSVGDPIIWRGEYQGNMYEDKGVILRFEPEKVPETTYWSSISGLADTPENYKKVTCLLNADGDKTRVTITQGNNSSEDEKNHSEQNWKMVLEGLKKVAEKNSAT